MTKNRINEIYQDLCDALTNHPCILEVWAGLTPDSRKAPPRGRRLLRGPLEDTWVRFLPDEPLRVSAVWECLTVEHAGVPTYWRIVTAEGICHIQGLQSHFGPDNPLYVTILPAKGASQSFLIAGQRVGMSIEGTISLR